MPYRPTVTSRRCVNLRVDSRVVKKAPVSSVRYVTAAAYLESVYIFDALSTSAIPSSMAATQKYDTRTDTWANTNQIPTVRTSKDDSTGAAVAETLMFKIYVIGGRNLDPNSPGIATNEAYNPVTDMWETKASMPQDTGTDGTFAGAWGDSTIIVGGGAPGRSAVHRYNAATDSWITGPPAAPLCQLCARVPTSK